MEKVLRNCKSFVEVLAMAHGVKVQHWTAEHFQRATTWCVYFEKAYEMMLRLPARSASIQKQLQREVGSLQEPWPSDTLLDFAYLQHCLSHLCSVLLRNPHSPPALLAMSARSGFSSNDVIFWTKEIAAMLRNNDLRSHLQPVFADVLSSLNGMRKSPQCRLSGDVAVLNLHAMQLCRCIVPGDKEKFSSFSPEQEALVFEVARQDNGVDIILAACNNHQSALPSDADAACDDVATLALRSLPSRLSSELCDWLLTCSVASAAAGRATSSVSCSHERRLFHTDYCQLTICAQRFDTFLDCYLEHLLYWTESFACIDLCDCGVPELQPTSYHWHHTQLMHVPINNGSSSSSFCGGGGGGSGRLCPCPPAFKSWEVLVVCFRSLAEQFGPVRQRCHELLQRCAQPPQQVLGPVTAGSLVWKADFRNNIWEDILERLVGT